MEPVEQALCWHLHADSCCAGSRCQAPHSKSTDQRPSVRKVPWLHDLQIEGDRLHLHDDLILRCCDAFQRSQAGQGPPGLRRATYACGSWKGREQQAPSKISNGHALNNTSNILAGLFCLVLTNQGSTVRPTQLNARRNLTECGALLHACISFLHEGQQFTSVPVGTCCDRDQVVLHLLTVCEKDVQKTSQV